jgi:hypothetical protein
MTHEEILKKICVVAAAIWGVPAESVYELNRKPERVDVRASIYFVLLELQINFTMSEIAHFVDRDYRTVSDAFHKIKAIEAMKPNLRTQREEILRRNSRRLLSQMKEMIG